MSGKILLNSPKKTLSRIGRKPILIPKGVTVELDYCKITVSGPKGKMEERLHPEIKVNLEQDKVLVERLTERKFHRSLHGLTRTLIWNAVIGVSEGYKKTLEIMGVGYRAQQSGANVTLNVGYSHNVEVSPLDGVTIEVVGNNIIHVSGIVKQKVGETAARIRKTRPPNAYKAKGIKYSTEIIRLKPGKAAAKA
jgi:large subunit ribosomal protein L6